MNLWPITRDDVALVEKTSWLVRPYVFVLALIGFATAAWTGSAFVASLGGIFFGANFAPMMPIWREAVTDIDRNFLKLSREQCAIFIVIWVMFVACCVAAVVLAAIGLL